MNKIPGYDCIDRERVLRMARTDVGEALAACQAALAGAEMRGHLRCIAEVYRVRGLTLIEAGRLDEAYEEYSAAIAICREQGDDVGRWEAELQLGQILELRSEGTLSQELYRKAEERYDQVIEMTRTFGTGHTMQTAAQRRKRGGSTDTKERRRTKRTPQWATPCDACEWEGRAWLAKARLYRRFGKHADALNAAVCARRVFEQGAMGGESAASTEEDADTARTFHVLICESVITIAGTHHIANDLGKAKLLLEQALDICRRCELSLLEVRLHVDLAKLHLEMGESDEAERKAEGSAHKALAIRAVLRRSEPEFQALAADAFMILGRIHEKRAERFEQRDEFDDRQSSLDEAFHCYLAAIDLVADEGYEKMRGAALLNIGRLYRRTGDYPAAQAALEQACDLARAVRDEHNLWQIHCELTEVYSELREHRRALGHHQEYVRRWMALADLEKQTEIAKLTVRFEIEQAKREQENAQLRAERAEADLKAKQAELNASMLRLGEKNQLLSEVREKLRRRLSESEGGVAAMLQAVLNDLDSSAGAAYDQQTLLQHVDQVYPGFRERLAARYPKLAPRECLVCCLIRMGHANKEIADILCISVRGVEAHRLNVRRKFKSDIASGDNLLGFLMRL